MHLNNILLAVSLLCVATSLFAKPTSFDQYLIDQKIIDSKFKIKDSKRLNEILAAMSEEDSRTLPYQVDQNMLMEKMDITANNIHINGTITTPDFDQFEQSVGDTTVKKLIKENSLHNCDALFEHQFQRTNPYTLTMTLKSDKKTYDILIKNSECKFK